MPDQKLIARVEAEIIGHRRTLADLSKQANVGLLVVDAEVAVSQMLAGCRLIIDRAMSTVWHAHGAPKPGAKKPNIYFPCKENAQAFETELQKNQLGLLQRDNPDCYRVIQCVQPFVSPENRWLRDLFELTKDKHEAYVEIESTQESKMLIGARQCGTIKQIVIGQDGKIYADADMKDSRTGKSAPLGLTFIEEFNHVLAATGMDTVTYCSRCLDRVAEVFRGVMGTLPPKSFRQEAENFLLPVSH